MYFKQSRNAFIRQYGPYTYIVNQVSKVDQVFTDAETFTRQIAREPRTVAKAVEALVQAFPGVARETLETDFTAFLRSLAEAGHVVLGESAEELEAKDLDFSYDMEAPWTLPDLGNTPTEEEDKGSQALHDYFLKHPTPFSVHFDLTSKCTEKCVHCYVPRNRDFFIDKAKCFEVMDQVKALGGLSITLSGGECMLHPDFDEILRYAQKRDFVINILTNLTLCTKARTKLLKEMNVSFVQVSLYSMDPKLHDAITQLPGSFERTKAAIERLHALNVPLQISCPTMRGNYKGYRAVLDYAASLRIKGYTDFIMMARSDHTTDNLANRLTLEQTEEVIRTIAEHDPEYNHMLRDYDNVKVATPEERAEEPLCGVGVDAICLNADGNYYPCSGFQDYPLGNCYEQTLEEVWTKSPRVLYLRSLRGKDIPQCIHCPDRNYCSTCLVRNFNETGDMLKVSKHFCDVASLNHRLVDEYRAKYGHGQCNGCHC